ncbi:MAG: hypothetical protein Q8S84_04470 [bacterium]|nr:hypothetical protein [bacterium]MDP3380759.1 hypothetical protein [bacterium]
MCKTAFLGSFFQSFISLYLVSNNLIHFCLILFSTICLRFAIIDHSNISLAGISLYVLLSLTYSGIII